jgi:phospholipid N-methyltransferase
MTKFHIEGTWRAEDDKTLEGNTWAGSFFEFCTQAIDDENLFKDFKQHPIFTSIVGSDVRGADFAQQCLNQITNPKLQPLLTKFNSGDHYGNPPMYEIEGIGSIAAGTLYHTAILNEILERVGEVEKAKVIEIGPGYGGQAKVLLDYGVESYTLIDMLAPSKLQQKYLGLFGYSNVEFWDAENLKDGQWDLVISNWCLSEFNNEGIEFYVNNIISKCKAGYFLMNLWDTERRSFVVELMKKHFSDVQVFQETIRTHSGPNWLLVVKK